MLRAAEVAIHRFIARQHLHDLAYLASDRQLRDDLGPGLTGVCRHAVRAGWSTRTTAAVLAALWLGILARSLEEERRMRLGETIMEQERRGLSPLDWIDEFGTGRLNVVGVDVFLLRFNVANGTLATWIAERRRVDPATRRLLVGMAAWGLSGLDPAETEKRFSEMLAELDG